VQNADREQAKILWRNKSGGESSLVLLGKSAG